MELTRDDILQSIKVNTVVDSFSSNRSTTHSYGQQAHHFWQQKPAGSNQAYSSNGYTNNMAPPNNPMPKLSSKQHLSSVIRKMHAERVMRHLNSKFSNCRELLSFKPNYCSLITKKFSSFHPGLEDESDIDQQENMVNLEDNSSNNETHNVEEEQVEVPK